MSENKILLILGNQLFSIEHIKKTKVKSIFMAEDFGLTTKHKHHKLKILMFPWSMRQYRDNLIKNGFNVYYHSIEDDDFKDGFEKKFLKSFAAFSSPMPEYISGTWWVCLRSKILAPC